MQSTYHKNNGRWDKMLAKATLLPYIILALSLSVTLYTVQHARQAVREHLYSVFLQKTERIQQHIEERVEICISALYGARGLFAASHSVERDEWRTYFEEKRLIERYPGITSMRYIERVDHDKLSAFVKEVQADTSILPGGYPNFSVYPRSEASEHWVVKYVEPYEGNESQMGYDLSSDSGRRNSLEEGRDLDQPRALTKVNLASPSVSWSDVSIYLPIYKNHAPHEDVQERREALLGFVSITLELADVVLPLIYRDSDLRYVDIDIYDGNSADQRNLIYDVNSSAGKRWKDPHMKTVRKMTVAGHPWLLDFAALPGFERESYTDVVPFLLLLGGGLFSIFLFSILYSLNASRTSAVRTAKNVTQDLVESEARFRELAENIDEVFWLSDPDLNEIYYVSPAYEKMWRRSCESLYENPHSFAETIHSEDKERVAKAMERYKTEGRFLEEYRILHPNASVHWIKARAYPIYNDKGTFYRVAGIAEDITERKKIEAQLLQSQKMETVGSLAGGIAHDLNNQLTPIRGYLDLLLKEVPVKDPIHVLLREANRAAIRCTEVVQKIVGFSKRSTQKKTPLDLKRILDEFKKLVESFMPATIRVESRMEDDIWTVHGNETELHTVLMNLAVNARDAMLDGGTLTIEAKNSVVPSGPHVIISARDTGAGMTPETLKHIFEPFFTTKPKDKGTGLGLAMVYKIIKDHGGWIDVSSQVGVGTVFQIYLPAEKRKAGHAKENASQAALPRGNETILFADDEEKLRNLGKTFLERLGYQVLLASDGREAVEIYENRKNDIDALILDMTMPHLTGRQTLQKILAIDPTAKVLLASGYTTEGTSDELIREGAKDFISKPFTIMPLAQSLRKVLDS